MFAHKHDLSPGAVFPAGAACTRPPMCPPCCVLCLVVAWEQVAVSAAPVFTAGLICQRNRVLCGGYHHCFHHALGPSASISSQFWLLRWCGRVSRACKTALCVCCGPGCVCGKRVGLTGGAGTGCAATGSVRPTTHFGCFARKHSQLLKAKEPFGSRASAGRYTTCRGSLCAGDCAPAQTGCVSYIICRGRLCALFSCQPA